jgi:hypothetical protein
MDLPKIATNSDLLKLVQYIEEQGRLRGWSTNMKPIPQLAEDIMADAMTEHTGKRWVVEVASTKGWDIRCEETGEKIEVKTTVSKVRDIGALKNKGASDRIACIWFDLEDKTKVDSVLIYPTKLVLENLKERKGKQPVFDKKGQALLLEHAEDLTETFRKFM